MGLKIFHHLLYPNDTGVPQWKGDRETGSWNKGSFKESFVSFFNIQKANGFHDNVSFSVLRGDRVPGT